MYTDPPGFASREKEIFLRLDVPVFERMIQVANTEGKTRTALSDYDATELPVEVGEEFQTELEEHGWLWCENTQGKWGWVRVANVERIDEA